MKLRGPILIEESACAGLPVYYNHNFKLTQLGYVDKDGSINLIDEVLEQLGSSMVDHIQEGRMGLGLSIMFVPKLSTLSLGGNNVILQEVSLIPLPESEWNKISVKVIAEE